MQPVLRILRKGQAWDCPLTNIPQSKSLIYFSGMTHFKSSDSVMSHMHIF